MPPHIIAYTDGGCRGNPGPGAWAFLVVDAATGRALERGHAEPETTNNRMEMAAAIEALKALVQPDCSVELHTDSRYLVDCCSKWMAGWKRRGWKRKDGPLKNVDLLKELDQLQGKHRVEWKWVKGHAGHPGNERVDTIANQCMDRLAAGGEPSHEARRTWP